MKNKINNKIKKYDVRHIRKSTGISEPTIYRYIKGEGLENHKKFLKLLKYLEISIDEFLKDENI